ncbi:ATP-binding protein [Corynebacterium minutissimum]
MHWTVEQLEEYLEHCRLRQSDTTTVEVKSGRRGMPQSLGATLCAFANMPRGGTVIIGVSEPDFVVQGVDSPATIESALADQARTLVEPAPYIETQTLYVAGRAVVLGHVEGLLPHQRPALYRGRPYLRMADGDYVMSSNDLRMVEVDKLHAREAMAYDSVPVPGSGLDVCEKSKVKSAIVELRKATPRLTEVSDTELLELFRVVDVQGQLSVAGLYALGRFPQGFFPDLHISAAVQYPAGDEGPRTRNLEEFYGSVPELVDAAVAWVERNIDVDLVYGTDGHVREVPELPMAAVREVIANAVVHRDLGPESLGAGKFITIRLTRQALIVTSPGGLRGISVEELSGTILSPVAVNPRLYTLATKLRLDDGERVIEGQGGGMRVVFDSLRRAGLRAPTLIDTGVRFTVILWRPTKGNEPDNASFHQAPVEPPLVSPPSAVEPTSSVVEDSLVAQLGGNAALVLSALRRQGALPLVDIVANTHLTRGQVRYALDKLMKSGRVVMNGKHGDRATRYAPHDPDTE